MKATAKLKTEKGLSNLAICLIGALLGLGAGLFFLRGYLFSPGFAFTREFWWQYSSQLYPLYYVWDEFTQSPEVINHILGKLWLYYFPAETGQRLFHLSVFPVMGLSMFFVTFKLTAKRYHATAILLVTSTLATLIFIMNPVVTVWVQHPNALRYYALLPLLVYFTYSACSNLTSLNRGETFKSAIYIALILFAMSPSERMPYYFPFLLLPFLAAFRRPLTDYLKKSLVLLGSILASYAVFSCFWWLPLALGSPSGPDFYVITQGGMESLSAAFPLTKVLNLTMPSWSQLYFPLSSAAPSLWNAFLIAIPIIAFGSLLLRRDKLTVWFACFALVIIFLAKGTGPPCGGFYAWLVFDSPVISSFGWQFRGAEKWMVPLMFCYAMLIGFTAGSFLGWMRTRVERDKLRRGIIAAVIIIIFLPVLLISGYSLLTGDLNGVVAPQEIPSEYAALNGYLEEQDSDGKLIFYPDPVEWGSAKPTITYRPVDKQPSYPGIYPHYLWNALQEGNTLRLGELISPYNAEEFVVRTEMIQPEVATELISTLSEQEDMLPVEQFGLLYVFENRSQSCQVNPAGQSLAVLGGLQNITSLAAIGSYHMTTSPIIFIDQLMTSSDYISAADSLVSNQGSLDLYLSLIEDDYLIKPFAFARYRTPRSCWSKGTTSDVPGAKWHRYLDGRGIENWQSDYGEGLVFTWATDDSLDISFKAASGGEYDLLMRCFQNRKGGRIRIQVDGQPIGEITTINQLNQFRWQEIGTLNLRQGKHTITLKNIEGFNAVNLLAVLPHGELERYKDQARYLIQDKRIVHIWEAESALNYSRATVSLKYGTQASNGEELKLSKGSQAWREIDILRAGSYNLVVRLAGKAVVNIDEKNFSVGSDSLSFIYLNLLYLDEGKHVIQIKSADAKPTYVDVIWLYSAQGMETVADIFTEGKSSPQLVAYHKINPTKYQVNINAPQPFMLAFAEAYNPLWVAKVNGKEYPSVPLNSVANGFWIEDSGDLEVTIEYQAQGWFYYGAGLTLAGLAGALGYLIWDWIRRRKIGRM